MGVFEREELPLFSFESTRRLEDSFTQKPMVLPLMPQREVVVIRRQEQNWVPIIAAVGLLSFFGFLAFLAYMRKT